MSTSTFAGPQRRMRPMLESWRAFIALVSIMAVGLLGVLANAFQAPTVSDFAARVGVGVLTAAAATMTGALLGFLFGIPRAYQSDQPPIPVSGSGPSEVAIDYRANTNLEQISDWLTKILVGVGLTQLTSLPHGLLETSKYVAQGLGGDPAAVTFASVLLVLYHLCGFLLAYLWTRLYLPGEFRRADTLNALAKKVAKLEGQAERDAKALDYYQRQVDPSNDCPPVDDVELEQAIGSASPAARALIFAQAQRLRKDNWRDNKPVMNQVIPVFRALVASDPNGKQHQYRGQLGFALKDREKPDWISAEAALTAAIGLRGSPKKGWVLYEFNRAVCNIALSAGRQRGDATDGVADSVLRALRVAAEGGIKSIVLGHDDVIQWLSSQQLTPDALEQQADAPGGTTAAKQNR